MGLHLKGMTFTQDFGLDWIWFHPECRSTCRAWRRNVDKDSVIQAGILRKKKPRWPAAVGVFYEPPKFSIGALPYLQNSRTLLLRVSWFQQNYLF